jgi:fluoride exporter
MFAGDDRSFRRAGSRRVILLYIALGGALGATARFALGSALHRLLGQSFPWGTLGVNLTGSFLLGVVLTSRDTTPVAERIQALLAIGFLGDFTTFSTFSQETIVMLRERARWRAAIYLCGSVVLCVAGIMAGALIGRTLRGA